MSNIAELIDECVKAAEGKVWRNRDFALFRFDYNGTFRAAIGGSNVVLLGEAEGDFEGEGATAEEAVHNLLNLVRAAPLRTKK